MTVTMEPRVKRDNFGKALNVEMTIRVREKLITLTEPIAPADLEAVARLRAESAVLRRAYETQRAAEELGKSPGWPSLAEWYSYWFWARYDRMMWGTPTTSRRDQYVSYCWGYIPERWHTIPMATFTPAMLHNLLVDVSSKIALSTTRQVHQILCQMFADAVRHGIEGEWRARENPMDFVKALAFTPKTKRVLSTEQVMALINESVRHFGGVNARVGCIALGAFLGLRVSEASGLTWERIDVRAVDDGVLVWQPSERKGGETGLRLPIPRRMLPFLPFRILPNHGLTGRVWARTETSSKRTINEELRRAAAAIGLHNPDEVTSHVLRHSYAHAIYKRAGASIADVSRALGHSSEEITRAYLRGVDDSDKVGAVVDAHAREMTS